jgi:hypothetical protein
MEFEKNFKNSDFCKKDSAEIVLCEQQPSAKKENLMRINARFSQI